MFSNSLSLLKSRKWYQNYAITIIKHKRMSFFPGEKNKTCDELNKVSQTPHEFLKFFYKKSKKKKRQRAKTESGFLVYRF